MRSIPPTTAPLAIARWTVLLAAGVTVVLTHRIWFGDSALLNIRPNETLWTWPRAVGSALWCAAWVPWILALVSRRPGRYMLAWCAIVGLRAAPDKVLWQPYFLQFWLLALVLGLVLTRHGSSRAKSASDSSDTRDADLASDTGDTGHAADVLVTQRWIAQRRALFLILMIVGLAYIWAGIHKLNPRFEQMAPRWLFESFHIVLSDEHSKLLGWMLPTIELAAGIALLLRPARWLGVAAVLGMHVMILGAIGPLGRDLNRVVWPWNVMLMILVPTLAIALRRRPSKLPYQRIRGWLAGFCVLVIFGGGPLLYYYQEGWPPYLSMRLYTFNEYHASLKVTQEVFDQMEPDAREVAHVRTGRLHYHLVVQVWANAQLGIFLPPDADIFRTVARRTCELAESPEDVQLVLRAPNTWGIQSEQVSREDCEALAGSMGE